MRSFDTNILLYAINQDCGEHEICFDLVHRALGERGSWIVADQVWFELYRLIRNPAVVRYPLDSRTAARTITWYREKSGWLSCAWEPDMMDTLSEGWSAPDFPARKSFDLVLALTLKRNGVRELYTRNVKDFQDFGLFSIINPLA